MEWLFYGNVYRSDSVSKERVMQKLRKKSPFTELPKETKSILE